MNRLLLASVAAAALQLTAPNVSAEEPETEHSRWLQQQERYRVTHSVRDRLKKGDMAVLDVTADPGVFVDVTGKCKPGMRPTLGAETVRPVDNLRIRNANWDGSFPVRFSAPVMPHASTISDIDCVDDETGESERLVLNVAARAYDSDYAPDPRATFDPDADTDARPRTSHDIPYRRRPEGPDEIGLAVRAGAVVVFPRGGGLDNSAAAQAGVSFDVGQLFSDSPLAHAPLSLDVLAGRRDQTIEPLPDCPVKVNDAFGCGVFTAAWEPRFGRDLQVALNVHGGGGWCGTHFRTTGVLNVGGGVEFGAQVSRHVVLGLRAGADHHFDVYKDDQNDSFTSVGGNFQARF